MCTLRAKITLFKFDCVGFFYITIDKYIYIADNG